MKKLTLFDDSIIDGEIGYDHVTGWAIPSNVKQVEFEDGSILQNPDFNLAEIIIEKNLEIEAKRKIRYQNESDPLFFAFQRNEITKQEWIDKVNQIKNELPYVE